MALLAVLSPLCACQSTRYDSDGLGLADQIQEREAANHASLRSDETADEAPVTSNRHGARSPRSFELAGYHDPEGRDRPAASGRSPVPDDQMDAGGASSPDFLLRRRQDQAGADAMGDSGQSDEDISNKLNNPGADLSFLNFKFVWNQYKGDLPDSSSQNAVTLAFQPVFPFKLRGEGNNLIIRPTIPVTWAPSFNSRAGGFDENFGIGDVQLVALFAHTNNEKGYFYGAGPSMQFPTHTDASLGRDDFRLGPAAYAGLTGEWGAAGAFVQHWWNIGGSDGYFSTTELNYFYWFGIGDGWQIGGAPIASYDWAEDDSDEAWSVPIGLGMQKTFKFGKTPVRIRLEADYYIVRPDSFGPHWALQLTITPVIKNPFG